MVSRAGAAIKPPADKTSGLHSRGRDHGADSWIVEPFLHLRRDGLYNPLTDRRLEKTDPAYGLLKTLRGARLDRAAVGRGRLASLAEQGWLVAAGHADGKRFLLKFVSIETFSPCNQACNFCPVSISTRPRSLMSQHLFESILQQLAPYQDSIEGVFLNFYNEPTIDPHFLARVESLHRQGLAIALLTNATGLTPAVVDALISLGGVDFLSVNLSTVDRKAYQAQRGRDHLKTVLRNLEYFKNRPLAERMIINVMGLGDEDHRENTRNINEIFGGSLLEVKPFKISDRCGILPLGGVKPTGRRLSGCEQMGSRPLQHLHITARGLCVLCCQDYHENEVLGDLTTTPLQQVLTGERFEAVRNMAYGVAEAPAEFLCRQCEYALHDGENY